MQTHFSHLPHPPELFTRERRLSRMRRFVEVFERTALPEIDPTLELLPIKVSYAPTKNHVWTNGDGR